MQQLLRDAKSRLRKENYRLTSQREVILEILARYPHRHFTAEEIHRLVREERPQPGLSTVYRTLLVLEDVGLIRRLDVGDGVARYELDEAGSSPHCHLVCLQCGEVKDIASPAPQLLQSLVETENFQIRDYSMSFYGLCGRCVQCRVGAQGGDAVSDEMRLT